MPSQLKTTALLIAALSTLPALAAAESSFNYDYYEVGISSTISDDDTYTSLSANGSMEINNNHYITANVETDIASGTTANEVGVGVGAYKSSSEDTDYYSRAGIKHAKQDGVSHQALNVGFGARHHLNETIELQGGIDVLFSTHEDHSGLLGNFTALYNYDETIQIGGSVETDGEVAETRLFARIEMP